MDPQFLERIQKILPPGAMAHFGKAPERKFFRINTLKAQISQICAELKGLGVDFQQEKDYPQAFSVPLGSAPVVLGSSLVAQALVYPQGLESMQAVIALNPQPKERVLDLCAAPGSKTSQIAAHMNNEGTLVANEPIRQRFYRLKSVVGLTAAKVQLTMVDARRYRASGELFDRVLVDAPCSSEGRFRFDEPKSFAYWSLRKIKEMAHKQKGIMLNASRLVKPGGVLVYSTCTFAPEENEEVVEWLARKAQGLALQNQRRILPDGRMEGFFIAQWQKF